MRKLRVCLLAILLLVAVKQVGATTVIGAPRIAVSGAQATVEWTTDVACGTRAKVTPDAAVAEPSDKTPTTNHRVTVSGLRSGTSYQISLGTARKWLTTQPLSTGGNTASPTAASPAPTAARAPMMNTRPAWGNPSSLPDHFARHGADFGATSPEDYARKAAEFLQRAKTEGLPAKLDPDGTLRVFDPKSGAFAAYNRNGTTKTFFKPGRPGYFERQPGRLVDLRHQ